MELLFDAKTVLASGIVDKALGTISGVSLISTPEAKGHNLSLDRASIESFYNAVEGKTIKAYYTHSPSNEALDSIGLWKDFEIVEDGEYTKLTAKFEALEAWKEHHKDAYDALFELADKAPEAFGVSAEFTAETIFYKEDGTAEKFEGQEGVEVFARAVDVSAFSIVAQPAANPTGLFAEKQEEQPVVNFEEIGATIVELKEENDGLVMDLKLAKQALEASEKQAEELREEIDSLKKELCSFEARYQTMVQETGSDPVHATAEAEPLTFEQQLQNCKTWAEKNNLINKNMSELVRTWNQ